MGPTEVGGFGLSNPKSPLLITDFLIIPQSCTEMFVSFESKAIADYFDEMIDQGYKPEQFGRIWIHTHPGYSASPSHVDRETFSKVFGKCDWGVMMILARGGETYAELIRTEWNSASIILDVGIDYAQPFTASNHELWQQEYQRYVHRKSAFELDQEEQQLYLDDPELDLTLLDDHFHELFYEPTTWSTR